jgi:hypothetical protein
MVKCPSSWDLLTHKPGFTIWGAGSIAGHVQHKGWTWSAWQCVSGGGWVGGFINTCSSFAHEAVARFAALLLCLCLVPTGQPAALGGW